MFHAVRENGGLISSAFGGIFSSLINYLLDVAELDPVKYSLNERFVCDSECNYPGLWLLIDKDGRELAINHLKCRYGNENVAKVIGFKYFYVHGKSDKILKKYKISSDYENKLMFMTYAPLTGCSDILLSKKPVSEYVPLTSVSSDDDNVSQYRAGCRTGSIELGPVVFLSKKAMYWI